MVRSECESVSYINACSQGAGTRIEIICSTILEAGPELSADDIRNLNTPQALCMEGVLTPPFPLIRILLLPWFFSLVST